MIIKMSLLSLSNWGHDDICKSSITRTIEYLQSFEGRCDFSLDVYHYIVISYKRTCFLANSKKSSNNWVYTLHCRKKQRMDGHMFSLVDGGTQEYALWMIKSDEGWS